MVRSQNVKFRISPCSASASFSFPTEHQNIICPKNFGCPKLSRFTQKESNKVKIYLPDFAQHQKTSPLEWSWKQGQHRLGCLVSAGLTRWIEVRHRNWDEKEELFVIWVFIIVGKSHANVDRVEKIYIYKSQQQAAPYLSQRVFSVFYQIDLTLSTSSS